MLKLATVKNNLTQRSGVPGLISGDINYEIKGGTSNLQWTGPKITPAVWQEVLAFFKQTYESTKSECQVRLYVNIRTQAWAAWAFPQEAKTGMTAHEIEGADFTEQRKQFSDADGWHYLGTVHHHCAASAFQSGVDHANEKSQDGLHITIGKMDEAQHDIHARFYLSGCEFIPDMSAFWDVGDETRKLLPASTLDIAARHQMTHPAPADFKVNEQWTKNLIDKNIRFFPAAGTGASPAAGNGSAASGSTLADAEDINTLSALKRRELAFSNSLKAMREDGYKAKAINQIFNFLSTDPRFDLIRQAAAQCRVSIAEVVMEYEWFCEQERRTVSDTDAKAGKAAKAGNADEQTQADQEAAYFNS